MGPSSGDCTLALLGDGTGALTAQTLFLFPATSGYGGGALADFDGDGQLDVARWSLGYQTVTRAFGDGTGGFGTTANAVTTSVLFGFLVVGDFNGDGKADLAAAFVDGVRGRRPLLQPGPVVRGAVLVADLPLERVHLLGEQPPVAQLASRHVRRRQRRRHRRLSSTWTEDTDGTDSLQVILMGYLL